MYLPGPGLEFVGEEELREVAEALQTRQMWRYRFDPDEPPSKVYQFEREMERTIGVRHAIGTNSCTSALLAGFSALGLGPGDEVIAPGYTFIASLAAIVHAKATPVLAEIDESLTLDPEDVVRKITPRTKAILAVHMLGATADLDALQHVARKHGLLLIEDVAQACGASYHGAAAGSIGAFGAFSLNIFKVITAGDGGVLTTNDQRLYERAFAFHDHGSKPLRDGIIDEDSLIGLNLRMHELTGAVALAQVRKLPRILDALRRRKSLFEDSLRDIPGVGFRRVPDPAGDAGTTLTLLFKDTARADRVATAIGSKTLIRSGKHYYGNMPQLLNKRLAAASCPFACPSHPSTVDYRAGMLPRTDDILSRALSLSVGVTDSYLGTDFGVTVMTPESDVPAKADEFRRRTEAALED
jgi:dTDP-4-amino-4,6-dideoxygalactose transaminase